MKNHLESEIERICKLNKNVTENFDVDKKLSELLRQNITIKHTKNEKKSYVELIELTINLEIFNAELERKNEMLKMEILKKDQIISDLKIQINENRIRINITENKLKMIENTFSPLQNIKKIDFLNVTSNKQSESNFRNSENEVGSSILEELSIEKEDVNSLIKEMKKNRKIETDFQDKYKNLKAVHKTLLNDLNSMTDEINQMREHMKEKDKIVSILYKEIENMKKNELIVKEKNPDINSNLGMNLDNNSSYNSHTNILLILQNHYDYFTSIRKDLIEFLKYYGINEIKEESDSNSNSVEENLPRNSNDNSIKILNELESKIEMRIDDIKYMLSNMNKINIIFKSLMVDFSKNLLRLVEKSFVYPINFRLNGLSHRYNKLKSILHKINITLK